MQLFWLLFGIVEFLTNGLYLITDTVIRFGKRQHSELPPNASDNDIAQKVWRMFTAGLVSCMGVAISLLANSSIPMIISSVLVAFAILYEAARYRYWKIYSELVLMLVLLVATIYFAR
jgi:hypothetical protein